MVLKIHVLIIFVRYLSFLVAEPNSLYSTVFRAFKVSCLYIDASLLKLPVCG